MIGSREDLRMTERKDQKGVSKEERRKEGVRKRKRGGRGVWMVQV